MSTKPFKITRAGKYLTRDGRTVEVRRLEDANPWLPGARWCAGEEGHHRYAIYPDDGRFVRSKSDQEEDIIAKGKKAKRRYVVRAQGGGQYEIVDRVRKKYVGDHMTRADARAFAAMKEAQRGGA